MSCAAVIFDLDGTVLENEHIYAEVFAKVLRKHSPQAKDNSFTHSRGVGLEKNWEHLKREFNLKAEVSQLVHETQDEYHQKIGSVLVRAGFFDLQKALKSDGKLVALATSNNWWLVEDELQDLSLEKYFDTIVTGEEVVNKKPSPDIFLTAARKLDVEPQECVVIEDSEAGVTAGHEAGMKVVAILNFFSKRKDFPQADLVVEGFEDLNPQVLASLF